MTLLKDVRLLLIVGLAIMCLLALRLCSSAYQPNTVGVTSGADNAVANADDENTASQSALLSVEPSASEEENSSHADDDSDEADDAIEADETDDIDDAEIDPVASPEQIEEHHGDDVKDEALAAVENVEANQDDQQATIVDQAPADEAQAESEPEAKPEESTADVTEVEADDPVVEAFEVVPSTIAPYTAIEAQKITLPAPSDSGEIDADLKTDLGVVRDGLQKYGERLDSLRTMVNKIKSPQ